MDDNPAITKALLYQAAVGLQAADFYVPKFLTFEEDAGPRRSWNWAPFFFGLFWFVYRRMYLSALVIGFIAPMFIGFMFMGALSWLPIAPQSWLWSVPVLGFQFGVVPLYSNFLYFSSVEQRIGSLRETFGNDDDVLHALERSPPTRRLFAIALSVLLPCISAYYQYVYHNGEIQDQVGTVIPQLSVIKTAVVKHYLTEHRWPDRIQDLVGDNMVSNQYLVDLRVDLGTISARFGNGASPLIAGHILSFRPSFTPTGAIVWTCGYASQKGKNLPGIPAGPDLTNVESIYLPWACR
jgi:hypothetical protein